MEELDNEASRLIEATRRSMLEARGVCTYAAGYSAKLLLLPTCLNIVDTHEGLCNWSCGHTETMANVKA